MTEEADRANLRLERRVRRLEATLEQSQAISDGNALLLNRLMDELDAERHRSHELLLNVLPARIVARLDAGETNIADRHDFVTVLMTDLVAFTPSAARLTAADLVSKLNDLFTRFDEACAANGVEKIKTIGDAYMAAAGLEGDGAADRSESVVSAANLALDMFAALRDSGASWQMRIGIHAGPVVAGIIGSRKFAYDIWGDTVNVASRLESTSMPDRIQISETVAKPLELSGRFELAERGEIELKGKGKVATWFLVGRRDQPPD